MAADDIPPDAAPVAAAVAAPDAVPDSEPVSPPVSAAELTPDATGGAAAETLPADDYDIPWKEAIEGAFPEFMAFYFRAAHDAIDWAQGHEFLDKELHQVVRDAASGKKFVDVLVRVAGRDGVARLL